MNDVGPLWSEREGRGPARVPLTTAQAAKIFASLVDDLFNSEQLQEAFGKDCVDDAGSIGALGLRPEHELLLQTGREDLHPVGDHFEDWDQDALLDAIELYGQLVSTGDPEHPNSYEHSYDQCGWHYAAFAAEPARSKYRTRVNPMLARYDSGFTLSADGQIERLVPAVVDELAAAPQRVPSLDDEAMVQGAIRQFRSRDLNDRRAAVKALADVLEPLRADVRELMTKADEKALFEIANKFWIRHNGPDQKKDYDHDAWWDWIFQVNLTSIRLLQRLKADAVGVSEAVDRLIEDLGSKVWRKGELASRIAAIGLSTLTEADQHRVGVAVGRRSVGQTVVVARDGLEACAASADVVIWPAGYRRGLLNGLFFDAAGRIETVQGVQRFAVQVLLPSDLDGVQAIEFVDKVTSSAFAPTFAEVARRVATAQALRAAATHLPVGQTRAAWELSAFTRAHRRSFTRAFGSSSDGGHKSSADTPHGAFVVATWATAAHDACQSRSPS